MTSSTRREVAKRHDPQSPVGVDDHIDPSRSAIPGTLLIWDWSEVAQAFRHPLFALIILLAGIPAGGLTFCAHRK